MLLMPGTRGSRGGLSLSRRLVRARGALLLIGFVVIAVDQWSKAVVRSAVPLNTSWNPLPWLEPFVTMTHIQNTGAAFGLLRNMGGLFVVVALGVIGVIVVFYRQLAAESSLLCVAFGLILGGATGNLIDRLILGYVTDFIDVRWWPVFNVADSAVVIGAILLAYYALFLDRHSEAAPVEDGVRGGAGRAEPPLA